MPGARRSSRRSTGERDAKAEKRRQEMNEGDAAVPAQDEEDTAPLFYLDREESVEVEEVEQEEEGEVAIMQLKRQKKQGEMQRRRQGQIAEADKDEEERMLERLVFGARDTAVLFDDQEAAFQGGRGQGCLAVVKVARAPAWQDEDDEAVRVDIAGKDRLRKLRRQPDERDISGADYQERLRARFQESNKTALDWAILPRTPADDAAEWKRGRRRRRQGEWRGDTSEEEDDNEEEGEEEEYDDDFGGLFRSSTPLVLGAGGTGGIEKLQPGTLEVVRCRDANMQEPSKAMVQAIQFHPSTGGLLFTAGLDKTLRFFQVDGKRNEKVAGVFFPDLPIQSASFVDPSGADKFEQVVVSGRRPFFYWYDTVSGTTGRVHRLMGREEKSLERFVASPDGQWLAFTGKDGYIVLVGAKSKQWAGEFKMNGTARSMAFSADGQHLLASGGDAVVYRWDLRSTRCLARFHNEGGTVTSALAASSAGMTAVGAESGVVNLYEDSDMLGREEREGGLVLARHTSTALPPTKALTHLTTTVDSLAFNHDGQLLAMASKWDRDALRVVHVPSRTVYANWPTGQTPIRYPSALAFSPNSGMLAVGNDRGRVLLYRLRHYDRA
eukprot:evm.model.NODE_3177_length_20199_cov_24.013615.7